MSGNEILGLAWYKEVEKGEIDWHRKTKWGKNPKIGDKGYYLGLPSSLPNICPGLKRSGVGREWARERTQHPLEYKRSCKDTRRGSPPKMILLSGLKTYTPFLPPPHTHLPFSAATMQLENEQSCRYTNRQVRFLTPREIIFSLRLM